MGTAWAYAGRIDLRRRWRALLALAVVIGLSGGLVTATAAAARRGGTAYERLADTTLRYDLELQDDSEGEAMIAASAELPGVVAHDQLSIVFASVGEDPLLMAGGSTGDFGYQLDRPVVLDGRLPAVDADDEVLLNEQSAADFGLAVGDTLEASTFSAEQFEQIVFGNGDPGGPPAGPPVELEVVGIGKIPDDLDAPDAASIVSPATMDRYRDAAGGFSNVARVRLAPGADPDTALEAMAELPGYEADSVYVTRGPDDGRRVLDATGVEATSTWIISAIAAIALVFVTSLLVARQVVGRPEEQRVLAASGFDRRSRRRAAVLPLGVVALAAGLLAVPVAIAASRWFPIGLSARAEPEPGVDVDTVALAVGAAATAAMVLGASVFAAWRLVARTGEPEQGIRRGHVPFLASLTRPVRFGPASWVGVRAAAGGSPDSRLTARSGLISLAVGVSGAVAVIVFAQSLDHVLDSPASYGVAWNLIVPAPEEPEEAEALLAGLEADEENVVGLSQADIRNVALGDEDVNFVALDPVRGDVQAVLVDGRAPDSPDEVALAPKTRDALGVDIGDEVTVPGEDGPRYVTVVGTVLLPVGDEDESGVGVLLTADGLSQVRRSDGFRATLVQLADGVDPETFADGIDAEVELPKPPTSVVNLGRARGLPVLLGAFLVVLAAAGALFGLAGGSRGRQLGVLHALGFDRRQVAAVFRWQAAACAVGALAVGVPVGVVIGRVVWKQVADQVGVVGTVAPALAPLAAMALATLLVALLLGSGVGWWSAHRLGHQVRSPE